MRREYGAKNSLLLLKLKLLEMIPCITNLMMFDFEKLTVYKKVKEYNRQINGILKSKKMDQVTKGQLRRSSLSILLNIAEGTGRHTAKDKRNFYVIARGSVFECVAILDYLQDDEYLSAAEYIHFYGKLDEISRMLFAMIRNMGK